MRILIITMDDPAFTVDFIKEIIRERQNDVVGVVVARGDRMRIGKKRSKIGYLIALLFIMGPLFYSKNVLLKGTYWLRKKMPMSWQNTEKLPLSAFVQARGIDVVHAYSLKDSAVRTWIREKKPDIIIHQSQNIVGKEILEAASIGVLNRHNALLPKNRGRLTPFWVLYRKEAETGVSIHWVTDAIDAGDIVYQEQFRVDDHETFASLVKKNYEVAPRAMLHALERIEQGEMVMKRNDEVHASYNSVPTLGDAVRFRLQRMKLIH